MISKVSFIAEVFALIRMHCLQDVVDKDENYGVIQDLMKRGREREEKKGDVIMTSQIYCLYVVLKIPFGKGSCSIGEIAHSASQWWTVISNTKRETIG